MIEQNLLQGVVVPLITPLKRDGSISIECLERLVGYQISQGVDGLFLFGSGGEFTALNQTERETILDTVLSKAAGKTKIFVGIMGSDTAISIDLGKQASFCKEIDALVLTAPFYFINTQTELVRHYTTIRENVDKPIVAYNVPSRVKVPLEPDTLTLLARQNVVVGIKDSDHLGSLYRNLQCKRTVTNFSISSGLEQMSSAALRLGADGIIPGLGNAFPAAYARIYKLCKENKWQEAEDIQTRLNTFLKEAVRIVPDECRSTTAKVLSIFKSVLCWRGVIETPCLTLPMIGLTQDEAGQVNSLLASERFRSIV